MSRPPKRTLLSIAFFGMSLGFDPAGLAADVPRALDYEEHVDIDLVQFEVTAWPDDDDRPEVCLGLTAEDFELSVNGRARTIYAADWIGSSEMSQAIEGLPVSDPDNLPLTLVLFFDLWHLDLFAQGFSCPLTKALAFDEARKMVREQFHAGDRLLLVTSAGWPVIHEGWIRDPDEALRLLDRVEVDPFVLNPRRSHSNHNGWVDGLKSLMLALGRYPGPKEVIYLADDFRFDDTAMQFYGVVASAQANDVRVHAPDLLWSCRSVPGPGCLPEGGLGCTEFKKPVALAPIASNTGGKLFPTASISQVVHKLRELRGCRYLLSFRSNAGTLKSRKTPHMKVTVRRKGVTLRAPAAFQNPSAAPDARDEADALFLLPDFGQGVTAEVGPAEARVGRA